MSFFLHFRIPVLDYTRSPSNLRPTTCECVQLVTCGHFWPRDKDGDRIIRSAVVKHGETPHAASKVHGSVFY